jgi:ubiquinone biosynthesis monooxygenase Coq7
MARNTEIEEMIRVDHAGEYGATRIYQGQIAVLEAVSRDDKALAAIRRMATQESRHLDRFNQLVNERQIRPTALSPVWDVAGFALGAATALLGSRRGGHR